MQSTTKKPDNAGQAGKYEVKDEKGSPVNAPRTPKGAKTPKTSEPIGLSLIIYHLLKFFV